MTEIIELKNRKIVVFNKRQFYMSVPKPYIDYDLLSTDMVYTVKFIPQKKKKK